MVPVDPVKSLIPKDAGERLIRLNRPEQGPIDVVLENPYSSGKGLVVEQIAAGLNRNNLPMVRVRSEPAIVLSTYPWRETSLIVELLTKHYGRVTVAARGAKRGYSQFRGLLTAFSPLLVNYSGPGDVKNLTGAKWLGGLLPLTSDSLLSGFYVNELLLKLTVRYDPIPIVFDAYHRVLTQLALSRGIERQLALRQFEIQLLAGLGWGQNAVENSEAAHWVAYGGQLQKLDLVPPGGLEVSDETALAIRTNTFTTHESIRESRFVLQNILSYYLGLRGNSTRKTIEMWAKITQQD